MYIFELGNAIFKLINENVKTLQYTNLDKIFNYQSSSQRIIHVLILTNQNH